MKLVIAIYRLGCGLAPAGVRNVWLSVITHHRHIVMSCYCDVLFKWSLEDVFKFHSSNTIYVSSILSSERMSLRINAGEVFKVKFSCGGLTNSSQVFECIDPVVV